MSWSKCLAALAACALLSLAACGGGGSGSTPVVQPPDPPVQEPDPDPDPPDTGEPEVEEIRGPDDAPTLAVPPMPQGVQVSIGIDIVQLWWDNPWNHYKNHGLTRIYRNTVNDFATATEIGTSDGISYTDHSARGGQTYFYWAVWETDTGRAGPRWASSGSEPSEDPADEIARISDEILNDPFTWELTGTFWRTSAFLGDERLFSATIYDDSRIAVQGTLAGSNPISGSAVWSGNVGAYDTRIGAADDNRGLARTPITGDARIEVSFGDATLDVDFTSFTQGHGNMSWEDLALTGGAFDGGTIEGAFYGAGHQGAAGTFDRNNLRGAFGAVRE